MPESPVSGNSASGISDSQWDEIFDVVVVGSGGGALTAALLAARGGASTLVVEKDEFFGGTTAVSGGDMWIPNNRFVKDRDSREDALAYIANLAAITIHMLLEHRSGLAEYWDDQQVSDALDDPLHAWTRDEVISGIERQKPAFAPGTRYRYTNANCDAHAAPSSNTSTGSPNGKSSAHSASRDAAIRRTR